MGDEDYRAQYFSADQYHYPQDVVQSVWDRYRSGEVKRRPIKVAVLDSGIMEDHKELRQHIADSVNFVQGEDTDLGIDTNGHGTRVAGIIAKYAPMVEIVNVKVTNKNNEGDAKDVASGLRYVLNRPDIDIVNLSFGCPKTSRVKEYERLLLNMVGNKVIIAAACNEGSTTADTIGN